MEWTYINIDSQPIKNIQKSLFDSKWTKYGYEIERSPHITIVPGFTQSINSEELPTVDFESVNTSGLKFYPSETEPMVVMLDVSDSNNLSQIRSSIVDKVGKSNVKYGLHPFHITLFKAGDSGDEDSFNIPNEVAEDICQKCQNTKIPQKIPVKDIQIEPW